MSIDDKMNDRSEAWYQEHYGGHDEVNDDPPGCVHVWNEMGALLVCSRCGQIHTEMRWESRAGSITIGDMETGHIANTIALIKRKRLEDQYVEILPALEFELSQRGYPQPSGKVSGNVALGVRLHKEAEQSLKQIDPPVPPSMWTKEGLLNTWLITSRPFDLYRLCDEVNRRLTELDKKVKMLTAERGPGIKPSEEPVVECDNGWDD